jgi:hypothetical protein
MKAAKKIEFIVVAVSLHLNRGLDERRHLEIPQVNLPAQEHDVERGEARSHNARQAERALLHAHVGRVDDEGLERGRHDHLVEADEAVPELEVHQQRAPGGARSRRRA